MKKTISLLLSISATVLLHAQPEKAREYFMQTASRPGFNQATIAAMAMTSEGDTLLDYNSTKMLVPASTMKLITTGTALHSLGADYRWKTGIGYDGTIKDGRLDGDLYIMGKGDPLLDARDSISLPIETCFEEWAGMLRKVGIKEINGRIIGDGRWIEGPNQEQSWLHEDLGTDYGAGVSGLNFYQNRQDFVISPGETVGAPIRIRATYPLAGILKTGSEAVTGEAGTGDKTYLFNSEYSLDGIFRGTYAIDRKAKTLHCSNRFPEYTCALYFTDYLCRKGIKTSGDTRSAEGYFSNDKIAAPADIKMIGTTVSPELKLVTRKTDFESNNFYAETLFRTIGKEKTGCADWNSSRKALSEELAGMGLGRSSGEGTGMEVTDQPNGLHIVDGSGLSRKNLVSPSFMCRFLGAMMDEPSFGDFLNSLPSPGCDGTMKYRMTNYPETMKKRIRYKSGSMEGVRCFSGYILPENQEEKTIIFSIMVNGYTISNGSVQTLIDRTISYLAQ